MSVIQFTVSCPCSYSLNYLVYRSFARDVERPSDSKLSVTDRFKPSAYSTTNTNSSSCSSRKYCDKKYRSNLLNKMSQQHKCSKRQKYWSFEIPMRLPTEVTIIRTWRTPKFYGNKQIYSQCTRHCKGHSMKQLSMLLYTNWSTHSVPEGVRAIAWHHYSCYFIQTEVLTMYRRV